MRSSLALGRTIVFTFALALIITGVITANGTVWPALAVASGLFLIGRVIWVAGRAD